MGMTTTRDYAAEYYAACYADRSCTDGQVAARGAAMARMDAIYEAALDAGVNLDVLGIDEAARVAIHG
jgi:hypothetical protein